MGKIGTWIFIAITAALVLGLVLFIQPISRIKDTPMMREVSRIHELCAKFRYYGDDHSSFPNGEMTNTNLAGLVAFGILSTNDLVYIRDNKIEYRGFDLGRVSTNVPVLETVFTNINVPLRILGYSDGHVTMIELRVNP